MTDVQARIQSAQQALGPLKACIYGRNKSGKTRFAGSSKLKTLVVDCREEGIETLRDRPNVDVYRINAYPEIEEIFWFAKKGEHPYEVFAIDTVTMLATLCMKWVLGERSTDPMVKPQIPAQAHWNQVTQAMENVILDWRDLPYHVLFLAQERTFTVKNEDGSESIEEVGPALSPQAQKTLLSAVGTIGRIYTTEVETETEGTTKTETQRRLLVGPDPRYLAGSRISGIPRVIGNPNLGGLLRLRERAGENA